jgi:hypothetical protein
MLIDKYAFSAKNIYALNYDGTVNTKDGSAPVWPGYAPSTYRIQVTGKGDRAGFQAAFAALKSKLQADDLLFILTDNHGDNSGGQSFLCQYPDWSPYWANDFCSDLATLPKYKSLMVVMEQCNSGGFNGPVIGKSTATNTSIASAAIASQSSWATPDGNFDSFAVDWISAQMGHDAYGGALASNPDTNHDGLIEAIEAYNYAVSIQNPQDSPNYNQSSAAGGNVTLDQQYTWIWWWCFVIKPVIEKYHPAPPDPEYYAKLAEITPELQKLVQPATDRALATLGSQLTPKVDGIVKKVFQDRSERRGHERRGPVKKSGKRA